MRDKCFKCGKELHPARSEKQCLYCGHRVVTVLASLTDRVMQFAIVNVLVWGAIGFKGVDLGMKAGMLATVITAVYLFGGFILARAFRGAGEWIAIGMSVMLAVGLFDWAMR